MSISGKSHINYSMWKNVDDLHNIEVSIYGNIYCLIVLYQHFPVMCWFDKFDKLTFLLKFSLWVQRIEKRINSISWRLQSTEHEDKIHESGKQDKSGRTRVDDLEKNARRSDQVTRMCKHHLLYAQHPFMSVHSISGIAIWSTSRQLLLNVLSHKH